MVLRGVKPEKIEKRLKVMFYGAAGCGKSTIAASFPKPYFIDTERGIEHQQYVDLLNKNGGAVFQTCDFDELIKEVKSLISEKHDYQTLVIDPITTLYNDLLDKSALKVGVDFGRHYSESNKQMKHLMNLLIRADLNIVITSHQKNEYGTAMAVIGTTFDSYKKMDYLVDLCVEVQKRGKDRIGVIKKSRIKSLPDGETFPFSYDEIASRYGRNILERNSVPEILATEEEVIEIKRLIDLLKVPPEVYQKWLDKADSFSFDEMPGNIINKCIESLRSKVKGDA